VLLFGIDTACQRDSPLESIIEILSILARYFRSHLLLPIMKLKNFFLHCSGASPELLDKCPTERSRYNGIGGAIFFTGAFAALAAGYALYTVFDNVWVAIAFGIFWGLMIFNLDRYIISSMRKEHSAWREFLMAVPRIILAVIISIVISKPLELRIFEKEISPELAIMEQQAYGRQELEVMNRFTERDTQLKSELNTRYSQIEKLRIKRDELVREAQAEADGTGGSKKKNLGPIYKIKKADADKAELDLQNALRESAPGMEEIHSRIQQNDSLKVAALQALKFSKRDGPAARMEAMERIEAQSPAIRVASWFILLLIIAIELAPVFVKLMSSRGPYDNLLGIEEHKFTAQAIEETGVANAAVRKRVEQWPEQEKEYGNDRLDSALRKL
jgi:hypothetical protein